MRIQLLHSFSGFITAATLFAASLVAPATAHADCGDPGQDPCTGPVPTVDQVVGILAELTDPERPAASKTDIVVPGFTPEEDQTLDDHLNQMNAHGGRLPIDFLVTNIQPAPDDLAGATVETMGPGPRYTQTAARPFVLADQHGHWFITHDSAIILTNAWYRNSRRRFIPVVP
ncbi:hypothetical protein PT015_09330 [Candidatus Mycobacterium wuenschmannii]|uniref:Low molecular weight antigen MTB12-like C-terminal domain-containing protein n=1 Tax=Candidatus Mycobacterium wuenschmannii TaxID=3027808 RepID=A0ABY8W329_9MYCO|nr:hypothetical protein [Candidatus Mycobacterium wuenschmannii]WIM89605.1 hypothetical protein PT015_09330 [Candidatus Mycobacterium wuenschmannii]